MTDSQPKMMRLNLICKNHDVPYPTALDMVKSGKLPAYKFGHRIYVHVHDFEALFERI